MKIEDIIPDIGSSKYAQIKSDDVYLFESLLIEDPGRYRNIKDDKTRQNARAWDDAVSLSFSNKIKELMATGAATSKWEAEEKAAKFLLQRGINPNENPYITGKPTGQVSDRVKYFNQANDDIDYAYSIADESAISSIKNYLSRIDINQLQDISNYLYTAKAYLGIRVDDIRTLNEMLKLLTKNNTVVNKNLLSKIVEMSDETTWPLIYDWLISKSNVAHIDIGPSQADEPAPEVSIGELYELDKGESARDYRFFSESEVFREPALSSEIEVGDSKGEGTGPSVKVINEVDSPSDESDTIEQIAPTNEQQLDTSDTTTSLDTDEELASLTEISDDELLSIIDQPSPAPTSSSPKIDTTNIEDEQVPLTVDDVIDTSREKHDKGYGESSTVTMSDITDESSPDLSYTDKISVDDIRNKLGDLISSNSSDKNYMDAALYLDDKLDSIYNKYVEDGISEGNFHIKKLKTKVESKYGRAVANLFENISASIFADLKNSL